MDPVRFDALARALARSGSRRRFIGGLVAGALGLAGIGPAAAAACRPAGGTCREHANCCSKACGDQDATGRRRCAAAPATATTSTTPACLPTGTPLDPCDGATARTCCTGSCTASGSIPCCGPDPCGTTTTTTTTAPPTTTTSTPSTTTSTTSTTSTAPPTTTTSTTSTTTSTSTSTTSTTSSTTSTTTTATTTPTPTLQSCPDCSYPRRCTEQGCCKPSVEYFRAVGGSPEAVASCAAGEACCGDAVCCTDQLGRQYCAVTTGLDATDAATCGACAVECGAGLACCGGERCARAAGAACAADADCCSEVCCGGRCGQVTGGACASNADCCAGVCVLETCRATCVAEGGPCDWPEYAKNRPDLRRWDAANDCCGDLVCGTDPFCPGCSSPPTCRPNRPPVAVDIDVKSPWKFACVRFAMFGYSPDHHYISFKIVTFPQSGFITPFLGGFTGTTYAKTAIGAGVRAQLINSTFHCNLMELAGIRTAEACQRECIGQTTRAAGPPQEGEARSTVSMFICPEGWYWQAPIWCYVTFSPSFTGTDVFTYVAVDEFGLESAPAFVALSIFEV